MNPKVDEYLNKLEKWHEEMECLRAILLDCQLSEELKWAIPVYTYQGKNVVGIGGFKNHCVLAFFKGVLLSDSEKILVAPGVNTQAGRMIRFANVREIVKMEPILKAYIFEAIEVEKAGLKLPVKKMAEFKMSEEFRDKLNENPALKKVFYALTPGRQRGYILYFSEAKQSKTRQARIEKCIQRIFDGKGLGD